MWNEIERLGRHHGHVPVAIQMLKLSEEVGEVSEAYIGMLGMNNRKGVHKTQEDVLSELTDVIITAGVAMMRLTDGATDEVRQSFEARLAAVVTRAGA